MEIEFEESINKSPGQAKNEDLQSEFHEKSVINVDDIQELEFEKSTTKTRGRPKHTKT